MLAVTHTHAQTHRHTDTQTYTHTHTHTHTQKGITRGRLTPVESGSSSVKLTLESNDYVLTTPDLPQAPRTTHHHTPATLPFMIGGEAKYYQPIIARRSPHVSQNYSEQDPPRLVLMAELLEPFFLPYCMFFPFPFSIGVQYQFESIVSEGYVGGERDWWSLGLSFPTLSVRPRGVRGGRRRRQDEEVAASIIVCVISLSPTPKASSCPL